MSLHMLRTLDCLPACGGAVQVGDTVLIGANTGPVYRVIAIVEDKAWVRDEQKNADHIVSVWRCYPAYSG